MLLSGQAYTAPSLTFFLFLRAVSDIDGYCALQYLFSLKITDVASWSNIRPHSSEVAKM
jgi:hypothetical protein